MDAWHRRHTVLRLWRWHHVLHVIVSSDLVAGVHPDHDEHGDVT
jgi:hypothetical protein